MTTIERSRAVLSRVATGTPEVRSAWERLAARNERLPVSQTPVWQDCICVSGPFVDASVLYRHDDGRELVLPLVRQRATPARAGLYEGWPFLWDTGRDAAGLVTDSLPSAAEVGAVMADLAASTRLRIRIAPSEADSAAWAAGAARWRAPDRPPVQVVPLDGGFAGVAGRFHPRVRNKLRKAERAGIEVRTAAGAALLGDYEPLHVIAQEGWARSHWLPLPAARRLIRHRTSFSRYVTAAQLLGPALRVSVAYLGGVPVGGVVTVSHGATVVYWTGALDRHLASRYGIGYALHCHVLETICAEGRQRYDLGVSGTDDLRRFKSSFGAHVESCPSYQVDPLGLSVVDRAAHTALRTAVTSLSGAVGRR